MAIVKLTRKKIESLPTPSLESNPRGIRYYDETLKGFGITAFPSGRKSFFIEYGPANHRRRMTLGQYGKLTSETARQIAKEKLANYLQGIDPLEEKQNKSGQITFGEFVELYLKDVDQRKKSAYADHLYLGQARKHWGKKPLSEVSADDIRKLYSEIVESGKKTSANRFHASVSACLQTAWRLGKIESNPTMKVTKLPENQPRDRVLTDEELGRMLTAIFKLEDPHLKAAFILFLLTGARKNEILKAKWEDFDFEGKIWRIPDPKKRGRIQIIPISTSVIEMLQQLPRVGAYVLPGKKPEKPRYDLKRPWKMLQENTGLTDLHIHDFRRSFGLAITRKEGIALASRLLRHSDISVTARVYSPFNVEDLRKAVEEHNEKIIMFPKAANQS